MRLRHALLGVCVAGLLGGCGLLFDFGDYDTSRHSSADDGGGGGAVTDAAGRVQLVELAPLVVRRTFPAALDVSVLRNGVEGAIALTVAGLPNGVSVAAGVIAPGATSGVLTFTSDDTATLGTSSVTVQATPAVGPGSSAPLTLTLSASRLDPTFGDGGLILGGAFEVLQDFGLDDAGRPLITVVGPPTGGLTRDRFIIYRVEADGGYGSVRTVNQSNGDGYRAALAPNGDFLVYDSTGERVESYPAAGGPATWSSLVPDLGDPNPACVRATSDDKVVVLTDGKLGSQNAAVVTSYFVDGGDPVATFGGDGGVYFSGEDNDYGGDLLVTDAGLLTCIVREAVAGDRYAQLVLVRITADGTIDPSFADGGLMVTRARAGLKCRAVVANGTGFVVAGELDLLPTIYGFLLRVDATGALDLSLGDAGIVTHATEGTSTTNAVAIDDAGGILSAGLSGTRQAAHATVFADLPDGAPNVLFGVGDGGLFPLSIGATSEATAIRVMHDGSLLVAGTAEVDGGATWFLARILP